MSGNDIVVRAILDDQGFINAWKNIGQEIKTNTNLWKTQFRELSSAGDWVGAYQAKMEGLQRTAVMYTREQEALEKELSKTAITSGEASKEYERLTMKLSRVGAQLAETNVQLDKTAIAYSRVTNELDKLAREQEVLSKSTDLEVKSLDNQEKHLDAAKAKMSGLQAEYENVSKQITAQREHLQNLIDAEKGETEEADKTRIKIKELEVARQDLTRGIKEAAVAYVEEKNQVRDTATQLDMLRSKRESNLRILEEQREKEKALSTDLVASRKERNLLTEAIEKQKAVMSEVGRQFGKNSDEYREQQKIMQELQVSYAEVDAHVKALNMSLAATPLDKVDREMKALSDRTKLAAETFRMAGDEANALKVEESALAATAEQLAEREEALAKARRSAVANMGKESEAVKELNVEIARNKELSAQNRINIDANSARQAETVIKSLSSDLSILSARTGANESVWRSQNMTLTANRERLIGLSAEYRQLSSVLASMRERYKTLASAETQNTTAMKEQELAIEQTRAKMISMGAEIQKLSRNSAGLSPTFNHIADHANNIGNKLKNAGSAMTNFGMNTVMNAGIAGAALAKGAKDAADLEHAYNVNYNLLKTSGEGAVESTKAVGEMQKRGRALSLAYGDSQLSIAQGYEELIRRGYDGHTALASLTDIMQASKASGDSLADTLQVTTSTLEGFGLRSNDAATQMKNTRSVANTLAFAADTTSTDFHSMGLAMSYVSQSAHSLGYDVGETASAIGVLSNNGLEAEKAGTGLRKVMTSLASPTKAAKQTLDDLGVSLTYVGDDGVTHMRKLPDIFQDLNSKIKDLPVDQQLGVLKTIFGQTGLQAAGILTNNFESLRDEMQKVSDSASSAGSYIQRLAHANMKDPASQAKVFKATLDDLTMSMGKALMPTAIAVMKNLESLMKWFSNLSDGTKRFIGNTALGVAGLGAFNLAMGPVVTTGGMVAKTISKMSQVIGNIKSGTGLVSITKNLLNLTSAASKAKKVEEVGKAAGEAAIGLGTAGEAAGGAGAAIGGLGAGLATALPIIGGVALALAAGAGAYYLYSQHAEKAAKKEREAAQERKYGTVLTKAQADEFNNMEKEADAAQQTVSKLSGIKLDTDNVKDAAAAYQSWADVINGGTKKSIDETSKKIQDLQKIVDDPSRSASIRQAAQNEINALNAKNMAYSNSADKVSQTQQNITDILNKAASEHRSLTKSETQQIADYNRYMLTQQIETSNSFTAKQKEALEKLINNTDLEKMSTSRLREANKNYGEALKSSLKDQVNMVNSEISDGLSKSSAWSDFFKSNLTTIKPLMNDFNEQVGRVDWSNKFKGMEQYGSAIDNLKAAVKSAGLDWNQFSHFFHVASADAVDFFATWDGYSPMPKDLKINADTQQAIKAISTTEAWNKLTPVQQAFIATDKASAKAMVAITKSKEWNNLSLNAQSAVLKDLASGNAKKATAEAKIWEGQKLTTKDAKVKDSASNILKSAGLTVDQWNKLPPKEKKIIANDLASGNTNKAKGVLDRWNAAPSPRAKKLMVDTAHISVDVNKSQKTIDSLKQKSAAVLNAKNSTKAQKDAAQKTLDSLKDVERKLKATNQTPKSKAAAQSTMNSLKDVQRDLKAINKAHGGKNSAQGTVNSFRGKGVGLHANNNAWGGKNSAQGTVNSFRGKGVGLHANNNAWGGKSSAQGTVDSFHGKGVGLHANNNTWGGVSSARSVIDSLRDKTVHITSFFESIISTRRRAIGDSNFSGGNVWLGDGGKNEPYMTPDGGFGISPSDWTLTALPAGSKIWPSISAFTNDTGMVVDGNKIPKFATGGTIPAGPTIQGMFDANTRNEPANQHMTSVVDNSSQLDKLASLMSEMVDLLTEGNKINKNNKPTNFVESARSVSERLAFQSQIDMRGQLS
ncbi:phage tail tape measure protein [Weissella confusa]|uniref:phage tail tape measure protein n=1 Tax=Weissella confusa TaxID=1583 RepID=UPI0021AEC4B5|nr:phage tail tape measure protein [Weissella confusa]MCS9997200.1 phage tail tape measure protein [Weissella confusa]